jgi:molecular chaperone DnaK
MGAYVGIDLGTTFSAISHIDETGRPIVLHNAEGRNITPSCVAIYDGKINVGEEARKAWGIDEGNVAARFKRDMGSTKTYNLDGKTFSPADLSAAVLKKLRTDAELQIGDIAEAVVTIPANFSKEAREATMHAAKQAGLNVKYIINEPTAAALYYAFKSGEELSGIYAVYDLGGGTFDVSVIQVSGQDVDVLASNGVAHLGGDDFDRACREIVSNKYKEEHGSELEGDDYLINDAEEEKKSLSSRKRVIAKVGRQAIEVRREDFEDAISHLIAQAEMLCEATIEEAGVEARDIRGVFLAGGSTRIPAVLESIKRVFGQEPISTVNVDEVVALGAALYAAYKSDGKNLNAAQEDAIKRIKVTESANMCFGTISIGMNNNKKEFEDQVSILIRKGEKIPCSVTESFYTVVENQTEVNCTVTESSSPETDPRFVKIIWSGKLELPPGRPKEQEVQITFGYDENQMMSVSFKDMESGKVTDAVLDNTASSGANNEIEKFMVE